MDVLHENCSALHHLVLYFTLVVRLLLDHWSIDLLRFLFRFYLDVIEIAGQKLFIEFLQVFFGISVYGLILLLQLFGLFILLVSCFISYPLILLFSSNRLAIRGLGFWRFCLANVFNLNNIIVVSFGFFNLHNLLMWHELFDEINSDNTLGNFIVCGGRLSSEKSCKYGEFGQILTSWLWLTPWFHW